MIRLLRPSFLLTSFATFSVAASLLACYRGVADSETVRIIQIASASPNRTALLVERSDHAALSGNTYFVFINDHPYSVPELRKKLYSLHPVMVAGQDGLVLHWDQLDQLTIECKMCGITKDIFEKREDSFGNVKVRYIGFP